MEEYNLEDGEFCGNVPEFGAIFMANTETRKVCFKKKIFGLPYMQANFVEQIKAGMPLFLFEYEKRQLFGVYRAASDGAMNIMPQAFSSLGKQFPAQVRFTPMWICRPLSESEFKVAISENYFSPKKFKFGLSEEQVWRLLQLFGTRIQSNMLPSRQLINDFHQSPKKVGERVGGDRSSAMELFEMKHGLESFSLSARHPFIDDKVDDGEGIFGQDFMADGSLIKNRRIHSERGDPDLYRSCDSLLESRAESPNLYLDNERIPPNSVNFSRGGNIFSISDSAVAPNFTTESLDLRKRAEWQYCFDGKDRTAAEDGRSLAEGIMRSEVDLDPFLLDHRYGVNINDGSYVGYLRRERGKNRNDEVLMSEKVLGLNHKDNYVRLGSLSEKFGTPLDGEQRRNDKQRFSSVDNQLKTSYIDCLNTSTALNYSGNDTGVESQVVDGYRFNRRTSAINELDTGNVTRAGISPKYNALNHSSSECLNISFPDAHFSDYNRNYNNYDSIFHDDIVRRIPDPPNQHHGRSSPMVVGQSASLARDTNPYLSHSNYRASSRGKTFEANGIGRSHISDVGNKVPGHIYSDYRDCAVTENSDSISLRSASAADYRGVHFSAIGFGSSPLDDRRAIDFHPYSVSPKYLSCQMPEEVFTSCEVQSPKPNLTDWDLRNQEYDAVNDELAFYNNNNVYSPHLKKGIRGYSSSECGASTGFGKQRKSVFTRLTSSSRMPNQAKDTDTDIYSPADELMEILLQGEKLSVKKLKRKRLAVEQLGEGETKKKSAMTSLDNCPGNSDMVFVPEKLIGEANKAVDGIVNETLTETRAVEFRRRRKNNRSIMCEKTQECKDAKKENDKSAENGEPKMQMDKQSKQTQECRDVKKENDKSAENFEPKIQMDKQSKRRKLVRPVFAVNLNNKPSAPSETTDNFGSCVNSATNASDGDSTHA